MVRLFRGLKFYVSIDRWNKLTFIVVGKTLFFEVIDKMGLDIYWFMLDDVLRSLGDFGNL